MKKAALLAAVLTANALAACGNANVQAPGSSSSPTARPTAIPSAAISPAAPAMPTPVVENGSGQDVTSPFSLPAAEWKISWTAASHGQFSANFIANEYRQTAAGQTPLEIANAVLQPGQEQSGSTVFYACGGPGYYMQTQTEASVTWTVTFSWFGPYQGAPC